MYLNAVFALVALVIMADLLLPGIVIHDEVIQVEGELQQYYNAASNHHYSYQVITNHHQFSVAEDFAQQVKQKDEIEYAVSPIFHEVNWYRVPSSPNKSVYSLRILSGLALPLLTIISMVLSFLYLKNINTLVFVLQVLLIADLVFLAM